MGSSDPGIYFKKQSGCCVVFFIVFTDGRIVKQVDAVWNMVRYEHTPMRGHCEPHVYRVRGNPVVVPSRSIGFDNIYKRTQRT